MRVRKKFKGCFTVLMFSVVLIIFSARFVEPQVVSYMSANKLYLQVYKWGCLGNCGSPIPEEEYGLLYPDMKFTHDFLTAGWIQIGAMLGQDSVILGFNQFDDLGGQNLPDRQIGTFGFANTNLEIDVSMTATAFRNNPFRDFIIFEVKVANGGSNVFENVAFGVFFDGIHAPGKDICGFRLQTDTAAGETVAVAWITDNDGNPVGGNYIPESMTSVMGVKILYPKVTDCQTSFNWWIGYFIGSNSRTNWGPTLQSNFNTFGFLSDSGLGRPVTQRERYYLMSNGEIDYDQYLSHLDHTGDGWLPPHDSSLQFAQGYYSVFLLSCGPIGNLYPNDTLRFSFAIVGGEDFHYDPLAYDSLNPQNASYDFSILVTNALTAQRLYDSLFNPPTDVDEEPVPLPKTFYLGQNYPNPFNATTTIRYHLPKASEVTLEIFNLKGQLVTALQKGKHEAPGEYTTSWDGTNQKGEKVSSGIYFYRLKTEELTQVKKMVLLR